jgi:hypothetical protein
VKDLFTSEGHRATSTGRQDRNVDATRNRGSANHAWAILTYHAFIGVLDTSAKDLVEKNDIRHGWYINSALPYK